MIRGISFEVPKGASAALAGPNGAGKTTTLKAIMGLLPHLGRAVIAGVDVSGMPPHKRAGLGVGYSPEDRRLFPTLTVEENIRLPIEALGFSPTESS